MSDFGSILNLLARNYTEAIKKDLERPIFFNYTPSEPGHSLGKRNPYGMCVPSLRRHGRVSMSSLAL